MTINEIGSVATAAAPVYSGAARTAGSNNGASVSASVSAAAPAPASELGVMSDAELEKIMEEPIKQANKTLIGYDRQIERDIHEVTKVLMYKIRDTKTNEVIAEYPPKKIQDMIAKMWELAGLFIDQKA